MNKITYTKELVLQTVKTKWKDEEDDRYKKIKLMILESSLEIAEQRCESEIERQAVYALLCGFSLINRSAIVPTFLPDDYEDKTTFEIMSILNGMSEIWVCPNLWLTPQIRVDIMIFKKPEKKSKKFPFTGVIVECDSFLFHSSPEQLLKEKTRERQLTKLGYPILRFSGREITQNATKVAVEIINFLFDTPAQPKPFSLEEEIEKLEDNPRRDLQIVGLYLSEKQPDIKDKEQLKMAIKRHLRAAGNMSPFDNNQIISGFKKAKELTPEWTIETGFKMVTK